MVPFSRSSYEKEQSPRVLKDLMEGCSRRLQSRQDRWGTTIQEAVAVVKTGCYKRIDKSFAGFFREILPNSPDIIQIIETERGNFAHLS